MGMKLNEFPGEVSWKYIDLWVNLQTTFPGTRSSLFQTTLQKYKYKYVENNQVEKTDL